MWSCAGSTGVASRPPAVGPTTRLPDKPTVRGRRALRLLAEGGTVVAADVSEAGLKDTVEKAGADAVRLTTVVVDSADEASVREAVAFAVRTLGGLDVLVNAAGSAGPGLPEDTDWSLFTKLAPALGQGFAGPETSEDGRFITGTEIRIDGGTHY